MSTETKRRINAISHFIWILLTVAYFTVIVLLGRNGDLQPDALKDTLSESLGYAISLVIFLIFYAIGMGIGVLEALIHGIAYLTRIKAPDTVGIWGYASVFVKAAILANCTFLAVLMGNQLLPEAPGPACAYIIPLGILGLLQILLFLMDLWVKKENAAPDEPSIVQE